MTKFQIPENEQRAKVLANAQRVLERKSQMVSGELVSTADIMRRLGISNPKAVSSRIARARKKPGPVTWESLGG